jgi:enamine deaminase RidA (YjgF/YER057c/UK114 family)
VVSVESRLAQLGIELPEPIPAHGKHTPVVVDRGIAYTSQMMATKGEPPALAFPGRLGEELSLEEGRESARIALLVLLANVRTATGDLNHVERFLHLSGFVAVVPGFQGVHRVIGAASDLVADIFGDELAPARTAVGVCELPAGASVNLQAILRLRGR